MFFILYTIVLLRIAFPYLKLVLYDLLNNIFHQFKFLINIDFVKVRSLVFIFSFLFYEVYIIYEQG